MHDDENGSHGDGADVIHEAPVDSSAPLEDADVINIHDDVTEVETQPIHLELSDEHRATRTRSQPIRKLEWLFLLAFFCCSVPQFCDGDETITEGGPTRNHHHHHRPPPTAGVTDSLEDIELYTLLALKEGGV
ncbi:unnamed protein product [Lactuca virosa]|uniref:Uncharacterized protein n=1 Tax=Lactuca virosa TaxID=75947 RepID=A0AAU9LR05_9ASTR|nr:unnamed protein product [Lactuca virosa]